MAIVQISSIQHRRGLQQDLPQLASGELGWALDSRRLYIGNGTPEEGAPVVGNTEILTEFSDILATLDTYTYKGEDSGYIVQTGPSPLAPVVRGVQEKLDEFVTSRDFGAKGSGVVDDSDALNRALSQLYLYSAATEPKVRRTLIIPAGTYRLSANSLRLLPNVKIKGAGKDRTIITQFNAALPTVHIADSLGQIGTSPLNGIGTNDALMPGNVEVEGITFVHATAGNIVDIESATNLLFVDCEFKGSQSNPIVSTADAEALKIQSNLAEVKNLRFVRCNFSKIKYVTNTSANVSFVEFLDCKFDQHFRMLNLGTQNVPNKPKFIKVVNSQIKDIASCAIYAADNVRSVFSSYNYYNNVGNNYTPNAVDPVIAYREHNCYSIGDSFSRSESEDVTVPIVSFGAARVSMLSDVKGLTLGTYITGHGFVKSLTPGAIFESSNISLSPNIDNACINYTIIRGDWKRTGKIRFVKNSSLYYDDDYVEDVDLGVDISIVLDGNTPTLYYSSTPGPTPVILLNIEHFKTYENVIPINFIYLDDDLIYLNNDPLSV
ncbi:MAG: hypothetical protein N2235_01485 [Fischerella sp.]|nr:hypothetical protein [Fischerella sp.]